jgi:hypothetical protein
MQLEKPLVFKREHAELQNMKFIHIFPIFGVILFGIRIQPTKIIADPCGSGSTTLFVTFSALGFKK